MLQSLTDYRIILIDDDPFHLKLLAKQFTLLSIDPHRIQSCLSCGEALEHIEGPYGDSAAIFLDLNMPEMDGVEFVRLLVDRQYNGALVLVSGEDKRTLEATTKLARARSLNVLGDLKKPVDHHALREVLQKWQRTVVPAAGRARILYTPDAIQQAIVNKELFNVYQPKVNVATGALVGVESLVRWRHPTDGLVFPDQFISVAQESGLIDALTGYVLGEALDQAKLWRDEGRPLRVSVNVSMDNLTNLLFPDMVLGEIARSGASASDLILEVTESQLTSDGLAPLDIVTRLRLKNIKLSIDDFGTGSSSLARLRDIPFDELKIDRSFVHGACRDPTLRGIFEGSLTMATQLEMEVVAEGVEDQADWDFLREGSCDMVQGYFVAKPMLPSAFPLWHAEWEKRRPEFVGQ